jgi:hypothetical protein
VQKYFDRVIMACSAVHICMQYVARSVGVFN